MSNHLYKFAKKIVKKCNIQNIRNIASQSHLKTCQIDEEQRNTYNLDQESNKNDIVPFSFCHEFDRNIRKFALCTW